MVLSDFSRRGPWNQERGHALRLTAHQEKVSGSAKLQAQRNTGLLGSWSSPNTTCVQRSGRSHDHGGAGGAETGGRGDRSRAVGDGLNAPSAPPGEAQAWGSGSL